MDLNLLALPSEILRSLANKKSLKHVFYVQRGVACCAICDVEAPSADEQPAEPKIPTKAKQERIKGESDLEWRNRFYREILPFEQKEKQILGAWLVARAKLKKDPENQVLAREESRAKAEIFLAYEDYCRQAVKQTMKWSPFKSDDADDLFDTYSSICRVELAKVLCRYTPGENALSKLLSSNIYYALRAERRKFIALKSGSPLAQLSTPDKRIREVTAFGAARNNGNLAQVAPQRKWNERKLRKLQVDSSLLEAAVPLDAPLSADFDKPAHEVISDPRSISQQASSDTLETTSFLQDTIREIPVAQRLFIAATFAPSFDHVPLVQLHEVKLLKNRTTGQPIDTSFFHKPFNLETAAGALGICRDTARKELASAILVLRERVTKAGFSFADVEHAAAF